jgi:hypothetical protein
MDNQVIDYRQAFSTDSGRRVLAHLLIDAGYFDSDMKTTEELAVLNYAKNIIRNMGICKTPDSVSEFINRILEISVGKE